MLRPPVREGKAYEYPRLAAVTAGQEAVEEEARREKIDCAISLQELTQPLTLATAYG